MGRVGYVYCAYNLGCNVCCVPLSEGLVECVHVLTEVHRLGEGVLTPAMVVWIVSGVLLFVLVVVDGPSCKACKKSDVESANTLVASIVPNSIKKKRRKER